MQLHRGFRGETWVFAILLPYLIYLCFKIFREGSLLHLVYLMMVVTVSAMWADLREWTIQLIIAILVCFGIFVATLIGRKAAKHGG